MHQVVRILVKSLVPAVIVLGLGVGGADLFSPTRPAPLLATAAELGLVTFPDAPAGLTNGDLR